MKNLKSFGDFMSSVKSIKENEIASRKPGVKFSDVVSEKLQQKLYEAMYEAMQEAVKYEEDEDPEHTLEGYLKECATCLGSAAAKTMHGGEYFNALKSVANQFIGEAEGSPKYVEQRDDLKEYLDACIDSMKESFCDKLDEVKKTNYASATLVLKKIKEERTEIYNKTNEGVITHKFKFKNNSGRVQVFNAKDINDAKQQAIEFFKTEFVFPVK